MIYEHTEIFSVRSIAQLLTFCKALLRMKREAPWSLTFTIALTATRAVEFRGSGKPRHIGQDLRDLSLALEGGHANPLPVGKPTASAGRLWKPKRKRKPDPPGY